MVCYFECPWRDSVAKGSFFSFLIKGSFSKNVLQNCLLQTCAGVVFYPDPTCSFWISDTESVSNPANTKTIHAHEILIFFVIVLYCVIIRHIMIHMLVLMFCSINTFMQYEYDNLACLQNYWQCSHCMIICGQKGTFLKQFHFNLGA